MNKVVVFGMDGASLKLIRQWKDDLPNLCRIMEGGVYGELESSIPPVTCPAWACMFTGKNPGKLGMYGFTTIKPDQQGNIELNNSTKYHEDSLWKILNKYDKKVGLLNIPMTYPPHSTDTFMVCGIGSPEARTSQYTYPAGLQKELDEITGGYEIWTPLTTPHGGKDEARYLEAVEKVVDERLIAAKYLMNNYRWDMFVCVFWAADQIQHFFWHYMDETHPLYKASKYQNVIKYFYQKIDKAIGELIKELPVNTNILVVSDHGFGASHGAFLVNAWLEKNGFLKFQNNTNVNIPEMAFYWLRQFVLSHIGSELAKSLLKFAPKWLIEKLAVLNEQKKRMLNIFKSIDWSNTKAYGCGGCVGMISINLINREPNGIVEEGEDYEAMRDYIIKGLKNIVDPGTGDILPVQVFKREEIYKGQYVNKAPDIIYLIDKYVQSLSSEPNTEWLQTGDTFYSPWTGWHVQHGVFMAYGSDIKKSDVELDSLKIYDITPTVLHMFGLPVADDIDGRVLTEIFKADSEPGRVPVKKAGIGHKDMLRYRIMKLKEKGLA